MRFAESLILYAVKRDERNLAKLFEIGHRLVEEAYSEAWSYLFDDVLRRHLLYFNDVAELNGQRTWLV